MPVVEADILTEGAHTLARCGAVTEAVLYEVFRALRDQSVALEGMVLKPSIVTPGVTCPDQPSIEAVADTTIECLSRVVPAAVPGVAFLSGGQPGELATARLNAMNLRRLATSRLPWALALSFARAIQHPALEIWGGQPTNVARAQRAFQHRASCNHAALQGKYDADVEADGAPPKLSVRNLEQAARDASSISSDPAWQEHMAAVWTTHGRTDVLPTTQMRASARDYSILQERASEETP